MYVQFCYSCIDDFRAIHFRISGLERGVFFSKTGWAQRQGGQLWNHFLSPSLCLVWGSGILFRCVTKSWWVEAGVACWIACGLFIYYWLLSHTLKHHGMIFFQQLPAIVLFSDWYHLLQTLRLIIVFCGGFGSNSGVSSLRVPPWVSEWFEWYWHHSPTFDSDITTAAFDPDPMLSHTCHQLASCQVGWTGGLAVVVHIVHATFKFYDENTRLP